MSTDVVEINVKKLIEAGLLMDSYFVLLCTHKGDQTLLEEYVAHCGKIDKPVFDKLIELGYLEPIVSDIVFDKLKLTKKALDKFGWSILDHKRYFKELKAKYPSRIKIGKSSRSLHQSLADCERKYKLIIDSEETHENILKCVDLYFKELKDGNRLEFAQMLITWINQKNYEIYLEEAISLKDVKEDGMGFVDDI